VEICASIKASIAAINLHKPELIFMDIELPDGYSFEIFDQLQFSNFEVIFITAFENYIKKAIDHYAFSYIVKPYNEDEFINKVSRYLSLKERFFSKPKLQALSNFLDINNAKILLHVGNQYIPILISNIIKLEANGNYTFVYIHSGEKYLASNSLKHYHELLQNKPFFKVNRSVIININYIKSIYKKETIILKNNDKIHVSVRNKTKLSELIAAIS